MYEKVGINRFYLGLYVRLLDEWQSNFNKAQLYKTTNPKFLHNSVCSLVTFVPKQFYNNLTVVISFLNRK